MTLETKRRFEPVDLFERNKRHVKPFLSYFTERVYSEKLRGLASQVSKSRGKYIAMGQADFWESPGDIIRLLPGGLLI